MGNIQSSSDNSSTSSSSSCACVILIAICAMCGPTLMSGMSSMMPKGRKGGGSLLDLSLSDLSSSIDS